MTPQDIAKIEALIMRPFKSGAQGPDSFDCWGLVVWVCREVFRRAVPYVEGAPFDDMKALQLFIRTSAAHRLWRLSGTATHGGLVEMGHNLAPHHLGLWLDLDGGGVLHCLPGYGVGFDRLVSLRLSGWNEPRFLYYDWVGA